MWGAYRGDPYRSSPGDGIGGGQFPVGDGGKPLLYAGQRYRHGGNDAGRTEHRRRKTGAGKALRQSGRDAWRGRDDLYGRPDVSRRSAHVLNADAGCGNPRAGREGAAD